MKAEMYKITVSEPWDYNGANEPNVIHGFILKALSTDCLIFQSDINLEFNGDKGKWLLLKSRFENTPLRTNNNYYGVVNGGLILTNDLTVSPDILESKSKFVLIGTLEKL